MAPRLALSQSTVRSVLPSAGTEVLTPQACLDSLNRLRNLHIQRGGREGVPPNVDLPELNRITRPVAQRCLGQFNPNTIAPERLGALVTLAFEAGQFPVVLQTLDRMVSDTGVPRTTAENTLEYLPSSLMSWLPPIGTVSYDSMMVMLRPLTRLADTLGGLHAQIALRSMMATVLRNTQEKRQSYVLVKEILSLVRQLDSVGRRRTAWALANQIVEVGRWAAEDGTSNDAVSFIVQVTALYKDEPNFVDWATNNSSGAYSLIGTRVQPLRAEHWLNMPPGTTQLDFSSGKVTLIEFTAYWCSPCKLSYRPLQALYDSLASRGFQPVVVTRLYGSFGNLETATPEVELAGNRRIFETEYKVTYPVAIANEDTGQNTNERHYMAQAVPMLFLIDREGILRGVWNGWNDHLTRQIRQKIQELLDESPAPRKGSSLSEPVTHALRHPLRLVP